MFAYTGQTQCERIFDQVPKYDDIGQNQERFYNEVLGLLKCKHQGIPRDK